MTIIKRSTEAYFLPFEGRVVGNIYQGGNIFRRFGRFVRRNVPNLLRNITPFIPRVADWIVTEGARRGHIPESHRKIYEESLRPYVRRVPSLLRDPIDALDKKLNPTGQTTASVPQQSVSQEGGNSIVLKHDFTKGETSVVGGAIKSTKKRTTSRTKSKSTSKKTTSKSKAVTTKSKPKIGTAEYHKIIDQHIAQFGAGILQTSVSHDMTHV